MSPQSSSPIRVLVADDDAILREIAGAMLRDAGFTVQTVAVPASAFRELLPRARVSAEIGELEAKRHAV